MARRNLDTNYFKSPFVRSLSSEMKLFYLYAICDCDHAGIWIKDWDICKIYTGVDYDEDQVLESFDERIWPLSEGKWFFPEIIEKQYPNGLSGSSKPVISCRDILNKYGLLNPNHTLKKPQGNSLVNPLLKGTDIDIDIDNDTTTIVDSTTKWSKEDKAFIDKLTQEHGDFWHIREGENARKYIDVWRWIHGLDKKQIIYLSTQLSFYKKIVSETNRFKCTIGTWMEGKWNEANYSDEYGETIQKIGPKKGDLGSKNAALYVS